MPKKFKGGEITKPRENVIVIPRQDVEFFAPPSPETEEAKTKIQDEMIAFIRQKGFDTAMDDSNQRCLLIDEGLGICPFKSLEEVYDYVKKGYVTADIERYKSSLATNGYPEDFHKLPFQVIKKLERTSRRGKVSHSREGCRHY